MISDREAVAIAELVVYSPLFIGSVYVNMRQGFSRQLGWYFLTVFCVIRLASGAMGVVSAENPTNITDVVWASILGSFGLSPLLLASFGLLHRVNNEIDQTSWRVRAVRLLHLPCLLGLVLAVVGGIELSSSDLSEQSTGSSLLKASGILFLLAFIGLVGTAGSTATYLHSLSSPEARIMIAILVAFPLLLPRIIYVMLVDFANSATFNTTTGSIFAQLGIAIIEEFIIVIIFVTVGILTPAARSGAGRQQIPPSNQGPLSGAGKYSAESQQVPRQMV